MWERTLSQKSVRLFCEQKVIDEAKADAYVYGYELLISSVVSVLLVVLIAVVCGDVRYALSFLIGFKRNCSIMLELLSFIMLIVRQLFYILGVLAFGKYLLKK